MDCVFAMAIDIHTKEIYSRTKETYSHTKETCSHTKHTHRYLVLDLITGGTVMDRIIAIDHFSEKDAAAVTADVSVNM